MMANILFSNIECLFLNLMIFNTKLSSLDGLVSFPSLKITPPQNLFYEFKEKKWSLRDFFWFGKFKSSRHSNKLGMFLLCVSNLKSEETRLLDPLVPGPLVY